MPHTPVNCIVVDDEPHAVNVLARLISKTPFLHLVLGTTSPAEGLRAVKEQDVQLVFLDIRMPHISGLDFIKASPKKLCYILCTAYAEHALESYDYDVVDYLLKPVEYSRFLLAVQKAMARSQQPGRKEIEPVTGTLSVKIDAGEEKIPFAEILYVETLQNYAAIYMFGKKHITRSSLTALEKLLPKTLFVRIHNSFIVNRTFVTELKDNKIFLQSVTNPLPVGITYRQRINEFLKPGETNS